MRIIKLFEIPVYGITKEKLRSRVERKIAPYKSGEFSEDILRLLIQKASYPMSAWDYNHIVGGIQITYDFDQYTVFYELFMPYEELSKYYWDSKRRHFITNQRINGQHFYITESMDNSDIAEKINNDLLTLIREFIPDRFYVDLTAFKNINDFIDYRKIMKL